MKSTLARLLSVALLLFIVQVPGSAQTRPRHKPRRAASSASPAVSAKLKVVPDLAQRLKKYKPVRMPFRAQGLTASERKMVAKLVEASRYLEQIYWRQSDPEALTLYQ